MILFYELSEVILLVDNNVIWDLDELGCLNLIFKIARYVAILRMVFERELKQELRSGGLFSDGQLWNIQEHGYSLFETLTIDNRFRRLSQNDRFLIAIASENPCYCVSNDGPVRMACEYYNIPFTGLLGVHGRAYVLGIIERREVDRYIERIQSKEVSCYLSQEVIDEFYRTLPNK